VKTALKVITTGGIAAALVAASVAGPASAANTVVPVTTTINVATQQVAYPAYTDSSLVPISTNAGDNSLLTVYVVANGATFKGSYVRRDAAGNGAVDVADQIAYAAFQYKEVPAGTYSVYLSFDAAFTDYNFSTSPTTEYRYTAAQSAPITVTVSKLASDITGWKAKTKSVKYKKLAKVSSPTVHNYGTENKVIVQYRKGAKGKWKSVYGGEIPFYSAGPSSQKITFKKFNTVFKPAKKLKNTKFLTRGKWYLRIVIPETPFVTGATSKPIKIVVK
jgi:hypothetical protein